MEGLAAQVRAGEVSARELTRAALDRRPVERRVGAREHHRRVVLLGAVDVVRERVVGPHGVELTRHLVEQQAHRGDEQRVAVGLRLGDVLGGDVAGRAGAVLDDHALAQRRRHVLGDLARDDVVRRAGTERHHDRDRLGREILGDGHGRHRRDAEARDCRCHGRAPGPVRLDHEILPKTRLLSAEEVKVAGRQTVNTVDAIAERSISGAPMRS